MNATISTIPKFINGKSKSAKQKNAALTNKQINAQNRLKAELTGWDKQSPLKQQIIALRGMRVAYKDIEQLTGATRGYIRDLCAQLGLTNHALQNKR
jgi:hypothetical protein